MRRRFWVAITMGFLLMAAIGLMGFFLTRNREFTNEAMVRQALGAAAVQQLGEELAGEWPQWRGPRRDGQVDAETAARLVLGQPGQRWEITLGEGYASPVIAAGKVIALARAPGEEFLVALDPLAGSELWRHSWPCTYQNDFGKGPRASPTVAGDRVFALGADGKLVAVRLGDGQPVWQVDLLQGWGEGPPRWGFAGSPLVYADLVVVQAGSPAGIVAFDRATGVERWRSGGDPAGYSSALLVRAAGGLQLVCLSGARLMGLKPDTGELLWEQPWATHFEVNAATPLVWSATEEKGDKKESLYVFISSGYGHGGCLVGLSQGDGRWVPAVVYSNTRLRSHFGSPVRLGEMICGFDEQMVTALDWRTGEARWKKRGYKKGSLQAAGDNLLLLSEEGELSLAKPGENDLVELWRMPGFGEAGPRNKKAWTAPVAAAGIVLLRDEERLICLELAGAPKAK